MITSLQNPKIQAVRALYGRNRQRREAGSFIIEGVRLCEEAAMSGWPVSQVFYSENLSERGLQLIHRLAAGDTSIEQVSTNVMQALADTETSQGILMVMPMRQSLPPMLPNFILIADAIRDPGNLGTILRTAWAAAVQAVILTPSTADAFSPKVLRAGMGAHFHLPILNLDWPAIGSLVKNHPQPFNIFIAEANQGIPLWEADLRQPCALLIGSEAEGPGSQAEALATTRLHIPMPGQSESINAAAAAAILLFEVVRQHRLPSRIPGQIFQ